MEDSSEDFRIDIIDFFIMDLDKRIEQDKDNELLQRIKLYMTAHKFNCMEYIYSSNRYKESAVIMTNIFKNMLADLCKDITNILP